MYTTYTLFSPLASPPFVIYSECIVIVFVSLPYNIVYAPYFCTSPSSEVNSTRQSTLHIHPSITSMAPRTYPAKRCKCPECLIDGEVDGSGRPIGRLFDHVAFRAHRIRIARSCQGDADMLEAPPAQMPHTAPSYPGPGISNLSPPRFNSDQFTSHRNNEDDMLVDPPAILQDCEMTERSEALGPSASLPSRPLCHHVNVEDGQHGNPSNALSRKEAHIQTQRALDVLKEVQKRLRQQMSKMEGTPSHEDLCECERTVVAAQASLGNLTRDTQSVMRLKAEVLDELGRFHARVLECRQSVLDLGPVEYDPGKRHPSCC